MMWEGRTPLITSTSGGRSGNISPREGQRRCENPCGEQGGQSDVKIERLVVV